MPRKTNVRKCMFCGGRSYRRETESEIMSSVNEDGTFKECLYGESWELCKEPGDVDKAGVYIYYKDGRCVGRFRELD